MFIGISFAIVNSMLFVAAVIPQETPSGSGTPMGLLLAITR